MTYTELESRINETKRRVPTDEEFGIITTVYNFHPSISETEGKDQIAELYNNFGMTVIRDMVPRAKEMQKLEGELMKARFEFERVQDAIKALREGGEN